LVSQHCLVLRTWILLVGFFRVLGLVLLHQHGRADFLFAALSADDADEIGTADLEILLGTQVIQFLQVNAAHGFASVSSFSPRAKPGIQFSVIVSNKLSLP
jgi:hypothetical protein